MVVFAGSGSFRDCARIQYVPTLTSLHSAVEMPMWKTHAEGNPSGALLFSHTLPTVVFHALHLQPSHTVTLISIDSLKFCDWASWTFHLALADIGKMQIRAIIVAECLVRSLLNVRRLLLCIIQSLI